MSVQITVDLKEIYRQLCPKCKRKLEKLVRDKLSEQLAKRVLE